jgi:crossover junction endodeoxyribonuclease RuvC
MTVIGLDTGLASCGLAYFDLSTRGLDLRGVNVFTSEPSPKKGHILASDDLARRAWGLHAWLVSWTAANPPDIICIEAPSWPRNASSASKMGVAFGVVYAYAAARSLPLLQASPQQIKKALVGKKDASKQDVINAVEVTFTGDLWEWPPQHTLWEHAADAVGAVVACLESDVLRMAARVA